jgi:hypothetical protein
MNDKSSYPYLDFPVVIDITLYKNNYYDNLIINKIKKDADCINLPNLKDVFIVYNDEFQEIFYNSFSNEVEKIRSLPVTDLQKNATSVYFLDKIFSSFSKLRYIKLNVSREANYSRINTKDKVPTIFFNYKITNSCINLSYIFGRNMLKKINNFLIERGLVDFDRFLGYNHQIEIKASEFLNELSESEQSDQEIVSILFDLIDPKTEQDDPVLLLITDFEV